MLVTFNIRRPLDYRLTQQYCCVMIPAFIEVPGAPYLVLPPGIHWATLAEVEERFATTSRRQWLFEGLVQAVNALQEAGCRRLFLDGSFVSAKDNPRDYDGCWDPRGVVAARLDPVLLDFKEGRRAQKGKYRGELFIAMTRNGTSGTFLDFFQIEKHTGELKGIVGISFNNISANGSQS